MLHGCTYSYFFKVIFPEVHQDNRSLRISYTHSLDLSFSCQPFFHNLSNIMDYKLIHHHSLDFPGIPVYLYLWRCSVNTFHRTSFLYQESYHLFWSSQALGCCSLFMNHISGVSFANNTSRHRGTVAATWAFGVQQVLIDQGLSSFTLYSSIFLGQ